MENTLKIAVLLAGAYMLVIAVLALSQTAMLFPRWAVGSAPPLPAIAMVDSLDRPGGIILRGHLLPGGPLGATPILGFGGNGWNAADVALLLHRIFPDHPVAAFHYRGYAPSTGRPSARHLMEDALAIHDHLQRRADWTGPPVVVGFSVGTGPAAYLSANRPVRGSILVTPFDSLGDLARTHYPWAPVGLLLRHEMTPAADLTGTAIPVALITAERDEIIPGPRADALRQALAGNVPGIVFDRSLAAGHNDLYGHPDFANSLRQAMGRITTVAAPPIRD